MEVSTATATTAADASLVSETNNKSNEQQHDDETQKLLKNAFDAYIRAVEKWDNKHIERSQIVAEILDVREKIMNSTKVPFSSILKEAAFSLAASASKKINKKKSNGNADAYGDDSEGKTTSDGGSDKTFTQFYSFCYLASLEKSSYELPVSVACELWNFLFSASSLRTMRTTITTKIYTAKTKTTGVLAKNGLLPRWLNRAFCKFAREKCSFVSEDTFLQALHFARAYRSNDSNLQNWRLKINNELNTTDTTERPKNLIEDFVYSLEMASRSGNAGVEDRNRQDGGGDIVCKNETNMTSSVSRGGRIRSKTVHPRGQKRIAEEASVDVLSSQLESALETKRKKTGGIRLDFF